MRCSIGRAKERREEEGCSTAAAPRVMISFDLVIGEWLRRATPSGDARRRETPRAYDPTARYVTCVGRSICRLCRGSLVSVGRRRRLAVGQRQSVQKHVQWGVTVWGDSDVGIGHAK